MNLHSMSADFAKSVSHFKSLNKYCWHPTGENIVVSRQDADHPADVAGTRVPPQPVADALWAELNGRVPGGAGDGQGGQPGVYDGGVRTWPFVLLFLFFICFFCVFKFFSFNVLTLKYNKQERGDKRDGGRNQTVFVIFQQQQIQIILLGIMVK